MQAIAKADRDIEKAKQQAEAKRWKLVADEMMTIKASWYPINRRASN